MSEFIKYTINIKGNPVEINEPWVMGILNVTPDSFYSGSRCSCDEERITKRIIEIVENGAKIIDIGGYSSRPHAEDISHEEEYKRLETGLKIIRNLYPDIIISVDTFRADVARKCVENYGVEIINDISGGDLDDNMFETVAELGVPYILMHMRGNPDTMMSLTEYENVTTDVIKNLATKVQRLSQLGVKDIIIDPGYGFSKTVEQNFKLIKDIEEFHTFNLPLLIGISRKSMIYKSLGISPEESLNGTSVLNTVALMKGAHILRVHDVKEAVQVVKLVNLINK